METSGVSEVEAWAWGGWTKVSICSLISLTLSSFGLVTRLAGILIEGFGSTSGAMVSSGAIVFVGMSIETFSSGALTSSSSVRSHDNWSQRFAKLEDVLSLSMAEDLSESSSSSESSNFPFLDTSPLLEVKVLAFP
ncbi:hypothetical protein L6452_38839 [Arctium lappa]|uniref:Uncharacterized protein n=1 Tax=Arctium lappa TaxID=4217 RepID=A0ACB8XQM2_ARCLA|nr:hypothetical protein L6452_38839 [Arctium lappa]